MPDDKSPRESRDSLPVPISLTRRAGDFVFVSGLGDHYFTPDAVTFDANGRVLDDGSGLGARTIEEQTRSVFLRIETALKQQGCGLEDVVGGCRPDAGERVAEHLAATAEHRLQERSKAASLRGGPRGKLTGRS